MSHFVTLVIVPQDEGKDAIERLLAPVDRVMAGFGPGSISSDQTSAVTILVGYCVGGATFTAAAAGIAPAPRSFCAVASLHADPEAAKARILSAHVREAMSRLAACSAAFERGAVEQAEDAILDAYRRVDAARGMIAEAIRAAEAEQPELQPCGRCGMRSFRCECPDEYDDVPF